jgi:cytochrome bd-type quinol oxidase subunit 1
MMESDLSLDPIRFPLLGNSIVVGIASLLHILLASPAVAFMVLAPVAELFGRKRPHYTEFAHTMTRFTLITYTASLVLAVIMVELFVGLFPLTNSWLFNRFRVAIGVAIAAFLLQLVALYPYYHYWNAIRSRSMGLHLSLGFVAALGILVWVTILDGIGSYMLTPGDPQEWSFLNPTFLPLVVHRFFGDVVVAGYLVAGYAAWRLQRAAESDRAYYRHMAKVGMLLGAIGLLLQPLTGYVYAHTIQEAIPAAYEAVVKGPYQPLVYLQFSLIALLFLGTLAWLRYHAEAMPRWSYLAPVIIALVMVGSVGHPGLRRFWTLLLVVSTAWILWTSRTFWTTENERLDRPSARWLAVGLAGCAVLIYLTMGTIRETARHPDTVRGIISLQEEAETPAAFRQKAAGFTETPAGKGQSR